MAEMSELDEDARELLDIKEYYDGLVESGRLNEDYILNEDYEDWSDDEDQEDEDEDGLYLVTSTVRKDGGGWGSTLVVHRYIYYAETRKK